MLQKNQKLWNSNKQIRSEYNEQILLKQILVLSRHSLTSLESHYLWLINTHNTTFTWKKLIWISKLLVHKKKYIFCDKVLMSREIVFLYEKTRIIQMRANYWKDVAVFVQHCCCSKWKTNDSNYSTCLIGCSEGLFFCLLI